MVKPLFTFFITAICWKKPRCRSHKSHGHLAALPVYLGCEQAGQNGEERGTYGEVIPLC